MTSDIAKELAEALDVKDHPNVPAAFINSISEEGSKQDAIRFLVMQWNETCFLRKAIRDALTRYKSIPPAEGEDWRDDPAASEPWNAGCDFAIEQLAAVLGVDPKSFSWDAATEELAGDVQAVIGNCLRAKWGDNWSAPVEGDAGEIVKRLREPPYRYAYENEDQAKIRRQQEREQAASLIEQLVRERDEALAEVQKIKERAGWALLRMSELPL